MRWGGHFSRPNGMQNTTMNSKKKNRKATIPLVDTQRRHFNSSSLAFFCEQTVGFCMGQTQSSRQKIRHYDPPFYHPGSLKCSGRIAKGQDGMWWQSVLQEAPPDAQSVYVWKSFYGPFRFPLPPYASELCFADLAPLDISPTQPVTDPLKTFGDTISFQTQFDQGNPFEVVITPTETRVFCRDEDADPGLQTTFESQPSVIVKKPKEIWVGISPKNDLTEQVSGYGREEDGNSMLLRTGGAENEYVFIGDQVITFRLSSPIKTFVSPVGNNDVPYPWAQTEDGDVLLLGETTMLKNQPPLTPMNDPYFEQFYENTSLTKNQFDGIQKFRVGSTEYNLRWTPDPAKDYDRLSKEGKLQVKRKDSPGFVSVNKKEYTRLMKDFGDQQGYQPLDHAVIISSRTNPF